MRARTSHPGATASCRRGGVMAQQAQRQAADEVARWRSRHNGKLQTRWRDGAEALVLSLAVDEVALVLSRAADEVALATELPHAPLFPSKARGAALAPAASPFPALAPTAHTPAALIGTYCRAHRHEQVGPGNAPNVAPTNHGVPRSTDFISPCRHAILYSKFDCGLW